MELYKRFPKLCTAWCCVEVALYAGQIFGWTSLLYILKREGFYGDLCSVSDGEAKYTNYAPVVSTFDNISRLPINGTVDNAEGLSTYHTHGWNNTTSDVILYNYPKRDCSGQDARLNLWFSISVGFSYFMCAFLGPLMHRVGLRIFRILFICVYVGGALCLGFATPALPWLVCPGLCCVGLAGMALYATNIQVSFLFPSVQSTVTSLFVGLLDTSTIVPQIAKLAFDNGIPRQYSYITLALLNVALVGTSTVLLLPKSRPQSLTKTPQTRRRSTPDEDGEIHEQEIFFEKPDNETSVTGKEPKVSLSRTMLSSQYILHVFWMSLNALRFVSFLGFLNLWLETLFVGDSSKESYFLGVFSYITMGTIITAVTAGLIHDWQRRKYIGEGDFRRQRLPIILPLSLTTILAVITTSFTFIKVEGFLYVTFIVFTFYRSYVLAYEATFVNDVFPMQYFTILFGVLHSSAGLAGMMQFALFKWYGDYSTAPHHVNIFLIVLELSTLVHPLNIWFQCRKHKRDPSTLYLNKEVLIEPGE